MVARKSISTWSMTFGWWALSKSLWSWSQEKCSVLGTTRDRGQWPKD